MSLVRVCLLTAVLAARRVLEATFLPAAAVAVLWALAALEAPAAVAVLARAATAPLMEVAAVAVTTVAALVVALAALMVAAVVLPTNLLVRPAVHTAVAVVLTR